MTVRRIAKYLTAAAVALSLHSCGRSDTPVTPPQKVEDVTLELEISLAEYPSSHTRAFSPSDDNTFEGPASDFEKIRTLRVVIVRNGDDDTKGIVEHNRLVMVNPSTGDILDDNLRFRVSSGEKKRIWIFANEAAVPYDFDAISEGSPFPSDKVADIRLSRLPNAALIDNSPASSVRRYIPMSEVFDVDVPKPQGTGDFFRLEHLFIVRSSVKFSFCITADDDYPESGVSVTGIKVYGLADSGWFMPRNTVYDPAKGTPSANPLHGRYITSFETPDDAGWSDYDFGGFPPVEIKGGTDQSITPYIYFPESKRQGNRPFMVSVVLDDNSEFLSPLPLDIMEIPRNTHVKVNIRMTSTGISPEVVLLPYTGVFLDPEFVI